MNEKILRKALGLIDDRYISAADRYMTGECEDAQRRAGSKNRIKYTAAAAVLCLLAAGALTLAASPYFRRLGPQDAVVVPSESEGSMAQASEHYSSLEQLLEVLSTNESHNSKNADSEGRGSGADADFAEGRESICIHGYCYRPDYSSGTTGIYLSGDEGERLTGSLDFAPTHMFVHGDMLAAVSSFVSGGGELDYEMSCEVRIYSLADPAAPVLTDSYIQLGELTACYMTGSRLVLMTSDGECACGWSRLDDKTKYLPALSHGAESIEWGEDEITVLAKPESVHYTAVTVIDTAGGVVCKHAFYGDIDSLWFGADWLALNVFAGQSMTREHPQLYTFGVGDSFSYTGKLSTAAVLGLPEKVLTAGMLPDGQYPYILSVEKSGSEYRIIGQLSEVEAGSYKNSLMCICTDMQQGTHSCSLLSLGEYANATVDEIIWEEERALVSFSFVSDMTAYSMEGRLVCIELDGGIQYHLSDMPLDRVSGVDGIYAYGSPLGYIDSFIPLGAGIYLRYNETPDGLDIFDLSDGSAPRCIYRSPGDIPAGCRLEFENYVYDENTVGIVMIAPGEQGDYRHAGFTWRVYRVDVGSPEPFTLISETPWSEGFDPMTAEH